MRTLLTKLWVTALLLTCGIAPLMAESIAQAAEPSADSGAVILMYHRFGESGLPSTNTTAEQVADHIAALQSGGHTVVPLDVVVSALNGEGALPDKAVAITVDDAYRSFLTDGWPQFKAAGFPVTLFVATAGVEAGYGDLLSWPEIKSLQAEGVALGAHSHGHGHYVSLSAAAVQQDLSDMKAVFERELGGVPSLFAFPYGEAGLADLSAVRRAGFTAAFGQHSGAAGPLNDLFYLPRFALNESYGGADRFRLVINTLPLPVKSVAPAEPVLQDNPPALTLSLAHHLSNIADLTCFGPRGTLIPTAVEQDQIWLTPTDAFPNGRSRINCTLQSQARETTGRWHWFGWQMIAGFKTEGVAVHPRYR